MLICYSFLEISLFNKIPTQTVKVNTDVHPLSEKKENLKNKFSNFYEGKKKYF